MTQTPKIAYPNPISMGKGVLSVMAQGKVYLRWRKDKARWEVEVRFRNERSSYQGWEIQGQYYPFTRENKPYAEALVKFCEARLVPNEDGVVTWHSGLVRTRGNNSKHVFSAVYKLWIKEYEILASKGKRSKEYVQHLKRYARLYWLPKLGNLHIREVNRLLLKEFYLELIEKDLRSSYVGKIMDGLSKLLQDFYEDEPDKCPAFPKYAKESAQRSIKRTLSEEEQDRVLECVPTRHRAIVQFIMYHGCRLVEARNLLRKDVDLKKGTAIIRTAKKGPDREIHLEADVHKELRTIPQSIKGFVFHYEGRRYSKIRLWKVIRRALDEEGFYSVTPNYAGWHSFISQRADKGQNALSLAYEVGHASVRTTQRYYHRGSKQRWKRGNE